MGSRIRCKSTCSNRIYTPLFFILIGIGNGIGAGVNSVIARYIGAKNDYKATNSGLHSIILSIGISLIVTVILLLSCKTLLEIMGANDVLQYALSYGNILFAGSFTLICSNIFSSIFRAEGDIKRATNPLILTAILNIILDPIFIYVLNMGIAGAAIATVLSTLLAVILQVYWMFIKRDMFLKLDFKLNKRDLSIYKDILIVGIPASLEQLLLAMLGFINNSLIAVTGGSMQVAAYTSAWRLISIGNMPSIGIGTALITVAGVAYGSRNLDNLKKSIYIFNKNWDIYISNSCNFLLYYCRISCKCIYIFIK